MGDEEIANYDLLKKKLRKFFKLEHFKSSVQKDAVKTVLLRRQDVSISMPPGCGKSLCFQLPGVMQESKTTIVFSPSSTLITDHVHYLKKCKIFAKSMTSATSENDKELVLSDLNNEKPETTFLYVTPDQAFTDTFNQILQLLHKNDNLAYFAVCDAHYACPSGENFQNEYMRLGTLRPLYPSIPWITLTANTSTEVQNDITYNFQLRQPIATFRKSTFRKNLFYDVILKNAITDNFVHLEQYVTKSLGTVNDKLKQYKKPCGIIYCRNRDSVELVAKELTQLGVSTKTYHRGIKSRERTKVLEDWIAGVFPVIIVTSTFIGGIDKSSVRFVVHWDVPESVVGYYKESGRAGRDGRSSYCRIYYCENTVKKIDSRLKTDVIKPKEDQSKALRAHADFVKIRHYCETVECRHKLLANYFDEGAPECKDRCDVCKNVSISAIPVENHRTETSSPIRIKEEPHNPHHANSEATNSIPVNGQFIKLEPSVYHNRSSGNVSPAHTVIKEEVQDLHHNVNFNSGNVSPTRTIIKEETDVADLLTDNKAEIWHILPRPHPAVSPANTLIEEPTPTFSIKREVVSPIAAVAHIYNENYIKSEPISPGREPIYSSEEISPMQPMSSTDPVSPRASNNLRLSTASTGLLNQHNVSDPTLANSTNATQPTYSSHTVSLREPTSPRISNNLGFILTSPTGVLHQLDNSDLTPVNSTPSNGAYPSVTSPTGAQHQLDDSDLTPINSTPPPAAYPSVTAIKTESTQKRTYPRLSLSPTNTIIKDEQRSPEDFLENLFNNSHSSRSRSPEQSTHSPEESRKRSRSRSSERRKYKRESDDEHRHSQAPPRNGSYTVSDPRTSEYRRDRKSLDRIQNREQSPKIEQDSRGRDRVSNHFSRNNRLSVSPTGTVIKEERRIPEIRTSTKNHKKRREDVIDNLSNNSYSTRTSSQERYIKNEHNSNESHSRCKREDNDNRRHRDKDSSSSSSSRKRSHHADSHKSSKPRKESRKRRRSHESDSSDRDRRYSRQKDHKSGNRRRMNRSPNEREQNYREVYSSDECRSPQPSTSAGPRKDAIKNWADIRFSVSPEVSPAHGSERKEDSDSDYGWEDPAPPKEKPEVPSSAVEDIDPELQLKLIMLNKDIKNEYDLDVIEAKKKELFKVIEDSIANQSKKKLTRLDDMIQKKADDFVRQLYGTDNFDNWDNDPALSNVETAKKIKSLKSHVPDDVPLLEKMSMKHVMKKYCATRLIQARDRNELVFQGLIKKIETEFQGQLPPTLLESIKQEKSIIAELVKKYLKPYHNEERIQPNDLFSIIARKICHIFYGRFADEGIIKNYIDDLFKNVGIVTSSTNIM